MSNYRYSKIEKPQFQLQKIESVSSFEEPVLYAIYEFNINRRKFIKLTSYAISSLVFGSSLIGCSKETENEEIEQLKDKENFLFYKEKIRCETPLLYGFLISPDGNYIVTKGQNDIKIWEIPSCKLSHVFKSDSGSINAVQFSSTGKFIAMVYNSHILNLIEVSTGIIIRRFEKDFKENNYISFMQNDQLMILGLSNGEFEIWDIQSGNLVKKIPTRFLYLMQCLLSPDVKLFVAHGYLKYDDFWNRYTDEGIHIIDITSGKIIKSFDNIFVKTLGNGSIFYFSKFISKSEIYINGHSSKKIWDIDSGDVNELEYLKNYSNEVRSLGSFITPNNNLAIRQINYIDNNPYSKIEIVNIKNGELIKSILTYGVLEMINFSLDNLYLFAKLNNTVGLYDLQTGKLLTCFFDKEATLKGINIKYYVIKNEMGIDIMYSSPCSNALPQNATCTCDCVEGNGEPSGGGGPCIPQGFWCPPTW